MRNSKLGVALVLFTGCLLAGCSDSESGTKPFVPPTTAQIAQYQETQIKSIQDNPNLSPAQKHQIIAMYQGAGRTAAQPAQSAAGTK